MYSRDPSIPLKVIGCGYWRKDRRQSLSFQTWLGDMADTQEPLSSSIEPVPTSSSPLWPTIPDFYAGKSIFITGATGFMGKCLLEKILRDLPEVEQVYILIRPKKEKSIQERVEDLSKLKVRRSSSVNDIH